MLRAIVIDDEAAGIDTLKILVSRNSECIRIVASTMKSEEGVALIEDYKPDVVFLDISMPGMSGFEILSQLRFREFKLVFITAHKEYAIEAIKNKAFDYLMKPVTETDFSHCVSEMMNAHKKDTSPPRHELLEIQAKDGIVYLKQQELVRLVGSGSYTELHMHNGIKHIASRNLKDFEARLDQDIFFRCHKSHIINLYKVQKFINHDGFYALMTDGSMSDISKNLKDLFLKRLKMI